MRSETIDRVGMKSGLGRPLAYAVAVLSVGLALAARLALDPILGNRQPLATFIIAVAVSAWFGGVWPGLVALVLGYLTADWFFIPERGALGLLHPEAADFVGLGLYMLVGGTITLLTESLRLARQRADREADAARASEARLAASQRELRALAGHLQSVREEERTRMARELHDHLGQVLTGLRLELSWLSGRLMRSEIEASHALVESTRSMMDLVDETVETVRRTATELRPGVLDDLGLAAAIEWQAADFQKRTKIRSEVAISLDSATPHRDLSTAVFRIVQEALTNVARHASAGHVSIALGTSGGQLLLEIADDGRGITELEQSGAGSLGLLGIRERARLLGGEVTITGVPGMGTTVTARMPLAPADRG
jgi:signal transduction histidine kinase